MAAKHGYGRRISYSRTRPADPGSLTAAIVVALSVVLLLTATLLATSIVLAAGEDLLLEAELVADAGTTSGLSFDLSGSAFIVPQQGMQVNETGQNLVTNPSLEGGDSGWRVLGGGQASVTGVDQHAGSSSLQVTGSAFADGIKADVATGGLAAVDSGAVMFSAYLKSAAGEVHDVWIAIAGDASGMTGAGPFTLDEEWRRFSVKADVAPDDSNVAVFVYPSTGGAAATVLVDAIQLETKGYLTPYFDGDQTGSAWDGDAHASTSHRAPGIVTLAGSEVGLDFTRPWWFALDVTLGFDRDDLFGSFPIGTKDFLNMGAPLANGTGMVGNEGVILDYYSVSKNLKFYKIGNRGAVHYPMPDFQPGDLMRVVCAWDPATGMELWTQVGGNAVFHASDTSAAARSASAIGPDWLLSVSDSGCWYAYGDYQSNSLHRNLVVRQGVIDDGMARSYLAEPAAFLEDCGRKPHLILKQRRTYWASAQDYQDRLLSVDYEMINRGANAAHDVTIVGAASTNGTMLETPVPLAVGDIAPGDHAVIKLRYVVPHGVNRFKTEVFSMGEDSCGVAHFFPAPLPGS